MILISQSKKTSKYFCNLPNHCLCSHDISFGNAAKGRIKDLDHLRYEEKVYQKLLTDIFDIGHQTIRLGTKNWYSDLSSDDMLIEVKNAKHTRSAIGQIICYEKAIRGNNLNKSIVLFGDLPNKRELDVYIQVCGDLNVTLVYVQLEELIELRTFICSQEDHLQKENMMQDEILSKLQKFAFSP